MLRHSSSISADFAGVLVVFFKNEKEGDLG